MSEKKRKATTEGTGRPNKKPTLTQPNPIVKVTHIGGPQTTKPVIASTPGVSLPANAKFESFAKQGASGTSETLLHSSDHPTIDFTAVEGSAYNDKHLKHYVAVYHPASGDLQVMEAKTMTVRSCVRQREPDDDDSESTQVKNISNYSSRAALTHTFGTKKSKKLVQAQAENALLSRAGNGADVANSTLSKALLSSMPTQDQTIDTAQSTASMIQANKPLPEPDLSARDVRNVYPLSSIVFPAPAVSTLAQMPISDWKSKIADKEPIETTSKFVATRVTQIAHAANSAAESDSDYSALAQQPLQLLRYVLVLAELARHLKSLRRGKPIPPTFKWASKISGPIPSPLLDKIVRKFCPNGTAPSKYDTDLLHTTILALTLHFPPPSGNSGPGILVTEPTDIQHDLNLPQEDISRYFRELGAKYERATEAELERWGLTKKAKSPGGAPRNPKFAKLKLPLEFPAVKRGKPGGSGRRK